MSIIRRITQSQLVRGSIFVFLANNAASFGNFLYNLFMGRLLGPEKYGDLGAIMSLLVLLSVPLGILSLLMVKIVSSYWGKKDYAKVKSLLNYFTPKLFGIGTVVFLLLCLSVPALSGFLHLDSYLPVLIIASCFILSFPSTFNRATLTGSLQFPYLALNGFIEIGCKLLLSVILVVLNFGLIGALLGPLIGTVAGYFLSIFELKLILGSVKKDNSIPAIGLLLKPTIPIFFAYLSLMAFFTVDIILVRHFFPAVVAGEYTALSTTGKIIYYAIGPIIAVMFPVISSRVSSGISYILPLFGTLIVTLTLSSVAIFVYFLFPKLIIDILFGSKYLEVVPLMGIFSFYITIYSINAVLTNFLLSISYYRPIYPLFLISLSQGVLISLFHGTLISVIWINIITSLFYLLTISFFVIRKEYGTFAKIFMKILPQGTYGG